MSCNPSALRLKRFCSMARSKEPRSQYCSINARRWVHHSLQQHCRLPCPGQHASAFCHRCPTTDAWHHTAWPARLGDHQLLRSAPMYAMPGCLQPTISQCMQAAPPGPCRFVARGISRLTGSPASTMPTVSCPSRRQLQMHPDLPALMSSPPPPCTHTLLPAPPHTRGLVAPHTAGCTVSTSRSTQVCSSCCLGPDTRPETSGPCTRPHTIGSYTRHRPQTTGPDSPTHCTAHLQKHPGLQLLLLGPIAVVQLLVILAPRWQVAVSHVAAGLAARPHAGGALLGFRGGRAHLVRGDLPTHVMPHSGASERLEEQHL